MIKRKRYDIPLFKYAEDCFAYLSGKDNPAFGEDVVYFSKYEYTCFNNVMILIEKAIPVDIVYYDYAVLEGFSYSKERIRHPSQRIIHDKLKDIKLMVILVTPELFNEKSLAFNLEVKYAKEHNIPILPLGYKKDGIEQIFEAVFPNVQIIYIDQYSDDKLVAKIKHYFAFFTREYFHEGRTNQIRDAFISHSFLSYRKRDRKYALKLLRDFHYDKGSFKKEFLPYSIWYDDYLTPGEGYGEEIKNAIRKAKFIILLITPKLLEKNNYVKEIEYPLALSLNKKIIGVVFEKVDEYHLKHQFKKIDELVYYHKEKDRFFNLLKEAFEVSDHYSLNSDEYYYLSLAYHDGIDVKKDRTIAKELLVKAKELGYVEIKEEARKEEININAIDEKYLDDIYAINEKEIKEENDKCDNEIVKRHLYSFLALYYSYKKDKKNVAEYLSYFDKEEDKYLSLAKDVSLALISGDIDLIKQVITSLNDYLVTLKSNNDRVPSICLLKDFATLELLKLVAEQDIKEAFELILRFTPINGEYKNVRNGLLAKYYPDFISLIDSGEIEIDEEYLNKMIALEWFDLNYVNKFSLESTINLANILKLVKFGYKKLTDFITDEMWGEYLPKIIKPLRKCEIDEKIKDTIFTYIEFIYFKHLKFLKFRAKAMGAGLELIRLALKIFNLYSEEEKDIINRAIVTFTVDSKTGLSKEIKHLNNTKYANDVFAIIFKNIRAARLYDYDGELIRTLLTKYENTINEIPLLIGLYSFYVYRRQTELSAKIYRKIQIKIENLEDNEYKTDLLLQFKIVEMYQYVTQREMVNANNLIPDIEKILYESHFLWSRMLMFEYYLSKAMFYSYLGHYDEALNIYEQTMDLNCPTYVLLHSKWIILNAYGFDKKYNNSELYSSEEKDELFFKECEASSELFSSGLDYKKPNHFTLSRINDLFIVLTSFDLSDYYFEQFTSKIPLLKEPMMIVNWWKELYRLDKELFFGKIIAIHLGNFSYCCYLRMNRTNKMDEKIKFAKAGYKGTLFLLELKNEDPVKINRKYFIIYFNLSRFAKELGYEEEEAKYTRLKEEASEKNI